MTTWRGGMRGGLGGRLRRAGIYVHIELAHIVVWQKPAQHGKAIFLQFSSVQFSGSVASDSLRPHGLQHTRSPCPSPAPGVYSSSCPFESVMPSNHLILCRPLLLLPAIFPSSRIFSNELVLRIRWLKYWSTHIL